MLEKEDNRFIIDAIAASSLRTSVYAQIPELAKLKLEKVLYPQGANMREQFLDFMRDLAESRANLPKDHKGDLFSLVVDAKDPDTGKGFSLPELWSESKFLIVAGKCMNFLYCSATKSYGRLGHIIYSHCLPALLSHSLSRGLRQIGRRDLHTLCNTRRHSHRL